MFDYNKFNLTEPKEVYFSRPNRSKIGRVPALEKVRLSVCLQDIWKIDCEIDKYINGMFNRFYDLLTPMTEIYIPDVGWFRIDSPPTEHQSGDRTYKTFSAKGIEVQLDDIEVTYFYINCGTELSYEMFTENIDALELPIRNIQAYIENPSDDPNDSNYWKYGTLNILERLYFGKKGWSIGHVDLEVASKRGRRFEIDSATGYNLLTNDISVAYECIFTFDRENKLINVYTIENIGKSLNIECSFRNLLNSVDISPIENEIYTQLSVTGANEASQISYVNFGSNTIFNCSGIITSKLYPQEFVDKYNSWVSYRETRRQEYADTFKAYLDLENKITQITTQVPAADVTQQWNGLTLEELQVELDMYSAMLARYEEIYTIDGTLQIEGTADYSNYISIKNVIIPDIESEIARKEAGSTEELSKVDYSIMWELYGINGLNERRIACVNTAESLKAAGYSVPWSADLGSAVTEELHNQQYQAYLDNLRYIEEIDARLAVLNAQVDEYNAQIDILDQTRKQIVEDVAIENETFGFTVKEISDFNAVLKCAGFKESSIGVVDNTDIDDVIQTAWDLYDTAVEELEIRCRPQHRLDISLDNIYHIPAFKDKANNIEVGDFMYLELDGGVKTKQRIIGMDLELVNFNDIDLNFTFSDAVNAYGKCDDFRFLLGTTGTVSSSSFNSDAQKYIQSIANATAHTVLANYISTMGGSGGSSLFPNGLSTQDILKLQDALSGLVQGSISLDELKVKLAQIDTLEADSAFINYLETVFFKAETGEFSELSATVANIKNAIIGTSATETGIFVNLTAENATISEALIKSLMAQYITVADLKAGNIITDTVNVLSADGSFAIVGNTMQFKDKDGNLRIQIGRDANDNFTFTLYDETGEGVLIDSTGIHASAISDGLIVNQMIGDGQVSKSKLDFNIVEADEDGKVDISVIKIDGEDFYAKYTTMESTVNGLAQKVEQNTTYILYIDTPNGTRMRPEGLTLNAVLFHNSQNVTDDYDASCFTWTRQSADSYGDIYWNDTHKEGTKTITITSNDLYKEATFKCTFEYEDVVAVASI